VRLRRPRQVLNTRRARRQAIRDLKVHRHIDRPRDVGTLDHSQDRRGGRTLFLGWFQPVVYRDQLGRNSARSSVTRHPPILSLIQLSICHTQTPPEQLCPPGQAATQVPLEQQPAVLVQLDRSRHWPLTQQPLRLSQKAAV
jgi:hypothetical protein